jgi:hypothetical protein
MQNPPAHFHVGEEPAHEWIQRTSLRLFFKEKCLWELRGFGNGPYFTDGPSGNIIFANDESLHPEINQVDMGSCRFPVTWPLVRIPTPHRSLEAFILLCLQTQGSLAGSYWIVMIGYMTKYLIRTGRLNINLVDPAFIPFLNAMMSGKSLKDCLDLGEKNLGERIRKIAMK